MGIYWDRYYTEIISVNLLVGIGIFMLLRVLAGKIAHVNASDEFLKKDNPAFGISLAGMTFAVAVMLSGVIYGSAGDDLSQIIISLLVFGTLGIGMMIMTRVILAKITLPAISLRDEIIKGNIAVAIADAGNVLAAAIIVRTALLWVTAYSWNGVLALIGGYAVSQLILTTMTLGKRKLFEIIHRKNDLQSELKNGNTALALRFSGYKIGAALVMTTTSQLIIYDEYKVLPILGAWFAASCLAILIWHILCSVARRLILFKVNVNQEVVEQKNIAIGALQAAIYVSVALLIATL